MQHEVDLRVMTDHLVEAAATELEDLRCPNATTKTVTSARSKKLSRAASMSPPNVPPCEEWSSLSETSESDDAEQQQQQPGGGGGSVGGTASRRTAGAVAASDGVEVVRRGFRRRNTVAITESSAPADCSGKRFPPNCLKLVRCLPGNSRCVDCGEMSPEWASVSYGALLCLRCSGRHRGLGVNVSSMFGACSGKLLGHIDIFAPWEVDSNLTSIVS